MNGLAGHPWFRVEALHPGTWAISEPHYWQQNVGYLLEGADRALLFDSGPGVRDIRRVAERLTDRPITVLASHAHFDHVGNHHRFERVAMADLPRARRAASGRTFDPPYSMRVCLRSRRFAIDEWLAPGTQIELGGRSLELVHLPGHTEESVGLLDAHHGAAFVGDLAYPRQPLLVCFESASVTRCLDSVRAIARDWPADRVHGAHVSPRLAATALTDLERSLETALEAGPPRVLRRVKGEANALWVSRRACSPDHPATPTGAP